MGIQCDINLHTPPSGSYIGTAGNVVSGIIKYTVDEETAFTQIIVSLKGLGIICLQQYVLNAYGGRRRISKTEKYLDIDHVMKTSPITAVGTYEIPFSLMIPKNIPPSVTYDKFGDMCRVICSIKYYVRIKFVRSGIMKLTKRFRKSITMVSGIHPKLPTTPITYGGQKKLTQLFGSNSSNVNIKADIINSVLKSGGKIQLNYNLTNNTKLTVNGVETKLVEVHKFFMHPKKPIVTEYDDIVGTDSKTCAVKSGETQEMFVEIDIPFNRENADFSKIYAREYCVFITAYLPLPHRNFVLKIPLQIGDVVKENTVETCVQTCTNAMLDPPSYWECMNEYKKDNIDLDEFEHIGHLKNQNVQK